MTHLKAHLHYCMPILEIINNEVKKELADQALKESQDFVGGWIKSSDLFLYCIKRVLEKADEIEKVFEK